MKKKIISVFVFGCLFMISSQVSAQMTCAHLTLSCGVQSIACGETVDDIIDSAIEQEKFFCNP